MKMIKKMAKMLKVYGINGFFPLTPLPPKEYVLYTLINIDSYGRPLTTIMFVIPYFDYHSGP